MANCIVSTISALADVIEKEFQYKKYRDLANKKETLMTQISRVGFNLGSKAADYQALIAPSEKSAEPESESEPTCASIQTLIQRDFPKTGTSWGNNNITSDKQSISCFEIGPGTRDKQEKIVISIDNNNITIYGNLTIRENTTLTIEKASNVLITGKLIMEENAKLIISDSEFICSGGATLNNSNITVSGRISLQGFKLDLKNTNCNLDFKCGVFIDGTLRFENTSNSKLKLGSAEYSDSDFPSNIFGTICS